MDIDLGLQMTEDTYEIQHLWDWHERDHSQNFGYKISTLGRHRTEDLILYVMVEYRGMRTIFAFSFEKLHLHQTRWCDGGRINITKSLKKAIVKHFSSRLGSVSYESITHSYWMGL